MWVHIEAYGYTFQELENFALVTAQEFPGLFHVLETEKLLWG